MAWIMRELKEETGIDILSAEGNVRELNWGTDDREKITIDNKKKLLTQAVIFRTYGREIPHIVTEDDEEAIWLEITELYRPDATQDRLDNIREQFFNRQIDLIRLSDDDIYKFGESKKKGDKVIIISNISEQVFSNYLDQLKDLPSPF